MRKLLGILAAVLFAQAAHSAELGDDGLHKVDWQRDTFKDLREDLEEANAEGKRLMVIIEPKIIPLSGNRANLVYEITEGSRTRVDAVNFVGNTAYTDRRLRTAILTRQTNLLRNLLQADGLQQPRGIRGR